MIGKVFILVAYSASVWANYTHNVCSSRKAYMDNMKSNPNCWYDPDLQATPKELAHNNGFIFEEHSVTTDDGYILLLFRLKFPNGLQRKKVAFLQHGLMTDATCFMVNKENSIAFYLARQGFDVWLGNFRGSIYSNHENLTKDQAEFWNYSYHEHGLHDLPANFRYIWRITRRKILYVGHSMGSTSMVIYASMQPDEAKRYTELAILLSPPLFMRNIRGLTKFLLADNIYEILRLLPAMKYNVLFEENSFEKRELTRFCSSTLENSELCLELLWKLYGELLHPFESPKLPFMLRVMRNAGYKDLFHYAQSIRAGTFRMFDHGLEENMVRYKKEKPPDYNLTAITIPLSFVVCTTDNLATKRDIYYAFETYKKPEWDIHEIPHNHGDFFFLKRSSSTLLPLLMRLLNKNV